MAAMTTQLNPCHLFAHITYYAHKKGQDLIPFDTPWMSLNLKSLIPRVLLFENCQPGKERSSKELALSCCTATRDLGLTPSFLGLYLFVPWEGKQSREIPALQAEYNKVVSLNPTHTDLVACSLHLLYQDFWSTSLGEAAQVVITFWQLTNISAKHLQWLFHCSLVAEE